MPDDPDYLLSAVQLVRLLRVILQLLILRGALSADPAKHVAAPGTLGRPILRRNSLRPSPPAGCGAPIAVMAGEFADKSAARRWVWDRLRAEGVARFRRAAATPDSLNLAARASAQSR
jgi:hypothetical protein